MPLRRRSTLPRTLLTPLPSACSTAYPFRVRLYKNIRNKKREGGEEGLRVLEFSRMKIVEIFGRSICFPVFTSITSDSIASEVVESFPFCLLLSLSCSCVSLLSCPLLLLLLLLLLFSVA